MIKALRHRAGPCWASARLCYDHARSSRLHWFMSCSCFSRISLSMARPAGARRCAMRWSKGQPRPGGTFRNAKRRCSAVFVVTTFIVFEHDATNQLQAASLTLWQRPDGYEVTNIVPLNAGSLSPKAYNDLLNDFARQIGRPAADATSFSLTLSEAERSLEDLAGTSPARALRAFISDVDSSAPTLHPADRKRWHDFLIAEFRQDRHLSGETLERWLREEAGWPADDASELAVQYERGLALLDTYAHEAVAAK